jgi:hypothetical protein
MTGRNVMLEVLVQEERSARRRVDHSIAEIERVATLLKLRQRDGMYHLMQGDFRNLGGSIADACEACGKLEIIDLVRKEKP